jgi:hypothetical protein
VSFIKLTIKELQMKFSQYFTTVTREVDDREIVKCIDNAPQALRDFIREVHGEFDDCLPSDWIYEQIFYYFELLEENDNEIDNISIEADVYNHELIEWLKQPFAIGLCDDVLEEKFCDEKSLISTISMGQYIAKDTICRLVHEFIKQQGEPQ